MPEIQLTSADHEPSPQGEGSTQRSLDTLASVMAELSQHRGLTPVMVTPLSITPEPIFFRQLASTLHGIVCREIRFDWFRQVPRGIPLLNDLWAMRLSRRVNRELTRYRTSAVAGESSLQITPMLARPGGRNRQFVVGWADETQKLPNWAAAIHLFDSSVSQNLNQSCEQDSTQGGIAA